MYGRGAIPCVTLGFRTLALFERYLLSVYKHHPLLGLSFDFLEHLSEVSRLTAERLGLRLGVIVVQCKGPKRGCQHWKLPLRVPRFMQLPNRPAIVTPNQFLTYIILMNEVSYYCVHSFELISI